MPILLVVAAAALLTALSLALLGLTLGLVVRFGPGTRWKLKLGRALAYAEAWGSGEDEDGRRLAAMEMTWKMQQRLCKDRWMSPLYSEILSRSQKGAEHHLNPHAVENLAGRK